MLSKEKIASEILPGIAKGVVYDSKVSNPIAGAEVTVLGTDTFFTTGDDGGYLILLPVDSYTLRVKAEGYQTAEVEIKVTFDKPLTQNINMIGLSPKQSV